MYEKKFLHEFVVGNISGKNFPYEFALRNASKKNLSYRFLKIIGPDD